MQIYEDDEKKFLKSLIPVRINLVSPHSQDLGWPIQVCISLGRYFVY